MPRKLKAKSFPVQELIHHHHTLELPIDLSDAAVFDVVYKSYYHPLCFYAAKFVQPEDAEDIIENVFLKLWNRKQTFNTTVHMQASLYHSVKNACLDHMKVSRNSAQRHLTVVKSENGTPPDHLHRIIQAEVLAEIYRAVNDLPAQCSKVITLGYIEGLNNAEIASTLGLSEQTVKNYKGRGLVLLRERLSGSAFTLLLLLSQWHH